jgi:hypothetical protein
VRVFVKFLKDEKHFFLNLYIFYKFWSKKQYFGSFFIQNLAISNLIVKANLMHIADFAVSIQMFQIQPNLLVMEFDDSENLSTNKRLCLRIP